MKVVFPRMETLYFHKAYDGGAKYVHYLAEELAKNGVEATIVTTRLRNQPELTETMHNGVKYVFLQPYYTGDRKIKINIPYKLIFSWNLKNYLEKTDFDILHSSESFAYFYLHKKNKRPVIYQTWAMEAWYGKETLSQRGLKKAYVKIFLRHPWQYVIEKSDSIAADGEFQIPRIEKLGVSGKKVFFLPNGVNFYQIQKMKKRASNRRKELGIKDKDCLVLSVCQISPDKGIEDIIAGFSMVKRKIPNAKLLMVGRGILEEKMYEMIKRYGLEKEVIHRKNVPEETLYDYYFSSDIFVSATLSEDFMITIQEAMAAGLPVVSSSQPYLVKDGINGYVIGFKNPKGMMEAILKIYKSKKDLKRMGSNSKKMAEEYDYQNLAQTAMKEYGKLSKNRIKIRKMGFFDMFRVKKMYDKSSERTRSQFEPRFLVNLPYFILLYLLNRIDAYVSEDAGDMMGFTYTTNLKNVVFGIMVREDYQGKGVGRKLMDIILRGKRDVWLTVQAKNKNAKKLYESFGFKELGRDVTMRRRV